MRGVCREQKKYGVSWLIPADAEKPADPRGDKKQPSAEAPECFLLTPTMFFKRNFKAAGSVKPQCYRPLLEADTAYRRGDPKPAMSLWRSTADDAPSKLTVATIATVAAISTGDFALYEQINEYLSNRIAKAKDKRAIALLSLPSALAAVSMSAVEMTPQWLKDGDFSLFSREHIPFLLYLYALHLRNTDNISAVLYTAKTSYELCAQTNTFTWLDIYNSVLCAQASFDLGDKERAKEYLLCAMRLGLPAGFIAPFADYLGTLGGLVEMCLDAHYPQYKAPVTALWNQAFKNWMTFHNQFTGANITTILTPREYQLARYIAHGASYAEASKQMHLSVGRVKNILLEVYSKLYISKRSQLTRFVT